MKNHTFAFDFETSFTRERSVTRMGVHNYLRHPETDVYMLSVVGTDGYSFVGHPVAFDWDMLGNGATWVAHNAAFDFGVLLELHDRRGVDMPTVVPHCSANLAAHNQLPRNLNDACKTALDRSLKKEVRDKMRGVEFDELPLDDRKEVEDYALEDSRACLELWQDQQAGQSQFEKNVSRHTVLMTSRGIGLDEDAAKAAVQTLSTLRFEASQKIPWSGETDAKGKEIPLTSPKELGKECDRRGLPRPATTDVKDPRWMAWVEEHGDKADFISAIQSYRKVNRLLSVVTGMLDRQHDGRLYYDLKYFGAQHTGRWSGGYEDETGRARRADDTGLNLQNLPRDPFAGVNVRNLLVPAPGKKFVIADYSQIEPRTTLWLTKRAGVLDKLRGGMDLYEAYARETKGYDDPRPLSDVDKGLRMTCKAEWLGLGYGMGHGRYRAQAKSLLGLDLDEETARRNVAAYRRQNAATVRTWKQLDTAFKQSVGDDFAMTLPSGRTIRYFDVVNTGDGWAARVVKGKPRKFFFGGKLFENLVQAVARDIMATAILRLEAAGLPVVLHVHDEVIVEVDADRAEEAQLEVVRQMTAPLEWCADLPLAVESSICDRYTK